MINVSSLSEEERTALNRSIVARGKYVEAYSHKKQSPAEREGRVRIVAFANTLKSILKIERVDDADFNYSRPSGYDRRMNYSRCLCGIGCLLMGHKHSTHKRIFLRFYDD